jgi:DNA repair protein RadA/Sms
MSQQRQKTRYVCRACGAVQPRWLGQCPECREWNTLEEEAAPAKGGRTGAAGRARSKARAVPASAVRAEEIERLSTRIG